jgi:hypothetical protein
VNAILRLHSASIPLSLLLRAPALILPLCDCSWRNKRLGPACEDDILQGAGLPQPLFVPCNSLLAYQLSPIFFFSLLFSNWGRHQQCGLRRAHRCCSRCSRYCYGHRCICHCHGERGSHCSQFQMSALYVLSGWKTLVLIPIRQYSPL